MNRTPWLSLLAGLGCALGAATVQAACPSESEAAELVSRYLERQPLENLPAMSLAEAECGRERVVVLLGRQLGRVVGYKAGLTNPAVQRRFNHDQPVRGTLLAGMLLEDGASVPARFGAQPRVEADLLVRVKDPEIHAATTPEEVMQHLDALIPFIELPDLLVQDLSRLNGAAITYINVGARLGVMGQPLPASQVLTAQLPGMSVRVLDGEGRELDRGRGSDVMGHPLQAVIWLARDLARSGTRLQAGDLLSLGSFSRPLTPQAGQRVRVVYEGLEGAPAVEVHFQ
ncbi:2-keto-4-pentenoate hydratase [Azotobacter salinestris]|uniref:2-keto-4-pentenoate hydratase n=1 Tax=Azotobacter salinestris TaxID=69964 RepID=UPI0032DE3EE4